MLAYNMFDFGLVEVAGPEESPYIRSMRRLLLLSFIGPILLLAGCEEGEGTQIGNEGIVATDPSETGCEARTLSADNTFDGWPGTLGDAADLLMSNLGDVQLDVDGTLTAGRMNPTVRGYRLEDGDCDHVYVDLEVDLAFDGVLVGRTIGELLIDIDRPSAGAEGELEGTQWSGSLLPAPSAERTLYLDVMLLTGAFAADVVLETCPDPDSCSEQTYGVIGPLP